MEKEAELENEKQIKADLMKKHDELKQYVYVDKNQLDRELKDYEKTLKVQIDKKAAHHE